MDSAEDRRKELQDLLDGFDSGRIPMMEFMRSANGLRDVYATEGAIGRAVIASFGRHTQGRDLMACLLEIFGFRVDKVEMDITLDDLVARCAEPDVNVLCISVQTTYDCPEILDVSAMLVDAGIRDRIVLNIGGSPITEGVAERAGCDVFSERAIESAHLIREEVIGRHLEHPL